MTTPRAQTTWIDDLYSNKSNASKPRTQVSTQSETPGAPGRGENTTPSALVSPERPIAGPSCTILQLQTSHIGILKAVSASNRTFASGTADNPRRPVGWTPRSPSTGP